MWHWGKEECSFLEKVGTSEEYEMFCQVCMGKACFHWLTFWICYILGCCGCCCCCCCCCGFAVCKMAKPAQPDVSNTVELPSRV
mmetsp:Transcript_7752/g.16062  ORF Transcript_7752/g.16062 Transcript_7752/m.16062 type:complete len:84 (-) Transcript_7752:75-326(-)